MNPAKIGIIGGSYGGYMTLGPYFAAQRIRRRRRFVRYFQLGSDPRIDSTVVGSAKEALYKKIGDPKTDRDMLLTYSPSFHADQVERPLMILHGANDPRVAKAESDDMVAAIKKKGGIVNYMVFADEGHGFTKRENQIKGYGAILVFLDQCLRGAPVAPTGG